MNFISIPRLSTALVLALLACPALHPAHAAENSFAQTILVANRPEYNPTAFVDTSLVNAWGIALRPPGAGGHIWISDATSSASSTYIGDVNGIPLHQDGLKIVHLDGPLFSYEGGVPFVTGQVYNAASDIAGQPTEFLVSGNAHNLTDPEAPINLGTISGSAKFVFVTTDGTINAWRSNTAASMDSAVIVKDYSDHGRDQITSLARLPAFTGVAMTTSSFTLDSSNNHVANNRIYATDFNNGIIRVLDNEWNDITSSVPFEKPIGLSINTNPYNIQYLNGKLYVTYAVLDTSADEAAVDDPAGAGHVYVYDTDGHLLHGFDDEGRLISPWGLAIAPEGFGNLGGKLLVGNFADGTIAAFDPDSGAFFDYVRDSDGAPLSVDGVWGIAFGNGVSLGDANSLYFAAGPNGEQDGTFGKVTMTQSVPEPSSLLIVGLAGLASVATRRRRR